MAGLLDALFSGGSGGGLLDLLRNNAMNQQPMGGLPSDQAQYGQQAPQMAPQFAPAMAQQNARPSPLDSAQWPAGPVGAPSQANAQMIPQQPPPVIQAQPMQPQGPSFGDHLMAGIQGFANGGGILPALANGIGGLATGQRTDPTGVALQTQQQQRAAMFQALRASGFDPQTAMAAALNPDVGNKLLEQRAGQGQFTQETDKDGNVWNVNKLTGQKTVAYQPKDDKFSNVTVKNPDGSETVRPFNQKTGEYGNPVQSPQSASSVDPGLTGQARMDAIMAADPNYGRKIQAMVNGDIPMPTSGQAARSPQAQKMVEDALAVSGSTSASDFATRAATRKDYASGVASRVTKSLNTTIEHAGVLDQAIDKLHNYTYLPGMTNFIHDKVASNTDPEYQKAKSEFESAKEAFIKELDFTLSGGHSSVSGSAELRDKINRADSPEALHQAIKTDLHLLSARLDSHTTGFNQGTKSQRDQQDFLYPKNRSLFNKLMGSTDTSTGQPVPGVSSEAPPAPGTLQPGQSTIINGVPIKRVN